MVDEVVSSINPVIISYKKGEENPLDSIPYLKKDLKTRFNLCLKQFRYYYSLHCLEERVFLFFSVFLINYKDGRKALDLKKEKEKLILFMLKRFNHSTSATNGDFKQFLGELGKFMAIMTIIFIFIPILKSNELNISNSSTSSSKKESEDEMKKSQREMIYMVKKSNPNFDESVIEDIFIQFVTSMDIQKSKYNHFKI